MRNGTIVLGLVGLVAVGGLTGCNAGRGTDTTTAVTKNPVTGTLSMTASSDLERVHRAAVDAMNDLRFNVTEDRRDAINSVVKARTANDVNITITSTRRADNITDVSVAAGPLNQEVAQQILDRMTGDLR